MKSLLSCFLILVFAYQFSSYSLPSDAYPILDAPETISLPRHLRIFKGDPLTGVSGSGQFSENTFEELILQLPVSIEELVIIDLREESHGLINGKAISWTDGLYNNLNSQKTLNEIEKDEKFRLQPVQKNKQITVRNKEEVLVFEIEESKTEEEFVKQKGARYIRFPVTDHLRPSDFIIDQFIEFIKILNKRDWIHLHCKAGKGRTTTFLVLLDAMMHAKKASLEEILKRQHLIGGADLTSTEKVNEVRTKAAQKRLELIKRFYIYCQEVPDFTVSWSNWNKQNSFFY